MTGKKVRSAGSATSPYRKPSRPAATTAALAPDCRSESLAVAPGAAAPGRGDADSPALGATGPTQPEAIKTGPAGAATEASAPPRPPLEEIVAKSVLALHGAKTPEEKAKLLALLKRYPEILPDPDFLTKDIQNRWVTRVSRGDILTEFMLPRHLAARRAALAGDSPTPLQQIVLDILGISLLVFRDTELTTLDSLGLNDDYDSKLMKRSHQSQRAVLTSVKTLAALRRLERDRRGNGPGGELPAAAGAAKRPTTGDTAASPVTAPDPGGPAAPPHAPPLAPPPCDSSAKPGGTAVERRREPEGDGWDSLSGI